MVNIILAVAAGICISVLFDILRTKRMIRSFESSMHEIDPGPNGMKELRLKTGLSQKKVSEMTGKSTGWISNVENGKTDPRIGELIELIHFYHQNLNK